MIFAIQHPNFLYAGLLAILLTGGTAGAVLAQQAPVRKHINFDEDWKFHLGNASDPHRDFNYGIGNILAKTGDADHTCITMDFDDRSWTPVQLPHDWAVGLPFAHVANGDVDAHGYHAVGGLFPENSVGWYRKHFSVDRADSGGRFVIQFDGIFRDSKVWINNCYLGSHFSGYSGSSYDITDFIRFNAKNTIVVRVDASQYEGWFYEGAGIYRHAWLNVINDLHIASGRRRIRSYGTTSEGSRRNLRPDHRHRRDTDREPGAAGSQTLLSITYITDRDGKRLTPNARNSR